MKRISIFLVSLFLGMTSIAQTNEGIDALNSEMYPTAKLFFKKQLADPSAKPEACYYLGETYRLSNKKDSAAYYFEMGAAGENPNSLCMVGKAGFLMSSNPGGAEDLIKKAKAEKAYKKKPSLYVAIAKVYAGVKQFDKAFEMLNIAKDMDKKFTSIYMTEGDILIQQGKSGDAAAKYETAVLYDANCKPAYLKVAQIYYAAKNYELALQYIDKIFAIDQNFAPALKLYGDICYEQGKYNSAVYAFSNYLKSPEAVLNDQIRYAYALFFNKEYEKSSEQINQLISHYPTNQVLKRILAYNLFETGKFTEGLTQMQDFFKSIEPSNIIASDYKYYARLLSKNNQDSLSIVNYQKAIETGEKPEDFYKEIASLYERMKKYGDAAIYLGKYIKTAETVSNSDVMYWGRDCYFAAGAIDSVAMANDPLKIEVRKNLYLKADSIFGELAVKTPDNYLGYFWRARVNAILDPNTETGLAKPYYEKVIEILEQPNKNNKKELLEAYQYLGYYYYLKEDFVNSKIYWNKILVIDPNNAMAQQAIEGMK